MFPKLKRSDREHAGDMHSLLGRADWCSIAFNSPLGYPYIVAVNHVLVDRRLYFHCADAGFKLDCLGHDRRVCVKAVLREKVISQDYTTDYLSVTAFGRASLVEDAALRQQVLVQLMERFCPGHPKTESCARDGAAGTAVVEIMLEHITGKENKAIG